MEGTYQYWCLEDDYQPEGKNYKQLQLTIGPTNKNYVLMCHRAPNPELSRAPKVI